MKYYNIKSLVLLLAISVSLNLFAAPPVKDYQIEMIIFKFNNSDDIYKEAWPATQLNIPANSIQLSDNADSNINYYKLLPKTQLKYNTESSKINNNSRYKVISHIGWIQPKKDLVTSKPVHIKTGRMFSNPKVGSEYTQVPEINGILSFSLKRFVHVNFDLIINLPARARNDVGKPFELINGNNLNGGDIYLQSFAINEQRRLKNKELNYFDNPAFGAVLVVSEVR